MRVLLDECMPRRFRRELYGHNVATIRDMGWSGKQNGELLAFMVAAGVEVLITVDQNLRYQQNLAVYSIGLIILIAKSNRLPDLLPLTDAVRAALNSMIPGTIVEVS